MPWSQEYRCKHGHTFSFLHMGSRETCPEFVPCEYIAENTISHVRCPALAEKALSTPYVKAIVKGNSDFLEREKARLTARSNEHWKKHGRHEAVDRIKAQRKKDSTPG